MDTTDGTSVSARFVTVSMGRKFKKVELFGTDGCIAICLANQNEDAFLQFAKESGAIVANPGPSTTNVTLAILFLHAHNYVGF